jgi:exosome complex component RRP41
MQNIDILALAGLRIDGRRSTDLRSMKHKLSAVKSADGSAYLEQGLNKVLVMVHGPQEPKRRVVDQAAEEV